MDRNCGSGGNAVRVHLCSPLNILFETMPIGANDWGRIFGLGLFVFLLVELEKALLTRLGHAEPG